MSRQFEAETQWDWADQLIRPLQNIVDRVGDYDPDDNTTDFEEMLLEPLSISGGESFTAEDHRGREILELLQNAQDAAGGLYSGDSYPPTGERAVYIGLSDHGLLVANTGDVFDFSDADRRKSLRILGHSETGEETIGQFGVGLTSIRSMGEAYEVWTKGPDREGALDPRNCWRVFCGPRTTLAAIASTDADARESDAYRRFQRTVVGGTDILDEAVDAESFQSVPLSAEQIPYFTYPVAMQSWYESGQSGQECPLRRRAYDLLTYGHDDNLESVSPLETIRSLLSDVGPFTTAVFVDYEDDDWRDLFEAITGERPASTAEDPATRLEDQAWFDGSGTPRVTPELLLNLGHIDRLVVERFGGADTETGSSFQDWEVFGRDRIEAKNGSEFDEVGRHITSGSGKEEVSASEVAVQVETTVAHEHLQTPGDSDTERYTYWDAKFTSGRCYGDYEWFRSAVTDDSDDDHTADLADEEIEVSMLLPTAGADSDLYRPHLYYPIDGADKQFPYCIHGDFVVQQNRQSLAGSALGRNCVVATEASRLVGRLSACLATADIIDPAERAAIPWRLLPTALRDAESDWPVASELAKKSSAEVPANAPIRALRAAIYRRLRQQQNIQVVADSEVDSLVAPGEEPLQNVVFHHNPTVVAGLGALYAIGRCASDGAADDGSTDQILERADSKLDVSIPTELTLKKLLRWLGAEEPSATTVGSETVNAERATRLEQLVTGEVTDRDSDEDMLGQWWSILEAWSEAIRETTGAGCAITGVPSDTGHVLLDATIELGTSVDDFPEASRYAPPSAGPYLLPCDLLLRDETLEGVTDSGDATRVQLVEVESHESGASSHRQVLRPESEDIEDIAPPAETGFRLYLLTDRAFKSEGGSITTAKWGTRKYEGPADLYRTLLKDVATRPSELSVPDIRFLDRVYDEIDLDEATADLEPVEGSYHAREQIETLASKRASVDSLKPRVDARRVTLPSQVLKDDAEAAALETQFGAQLLQYWLANHTEASEEHDVAVDEDSDRGEGWLSDPPIRTNGPVATLPSVVENQGDATESLLPARLTTQLGMLGVSMVSDVRTLLIRGDDAHPDRQSISSWNPTTWSAADNDRLQALQSVLETVPGADYLALLTTPPFGPGESSDHTTYCNIKDFPRKAKPPGEELADYDVVLVSWTWLPPRTLNQIAGSDLAELLAVSGKALADSILGTGWSCNYGGGNIKSIDTFVPTLLNWQLRTVSGWDDVDWFHTPDTEDLWADHDEWTLQYAVLDSVSSRRTAAAALPRIDPAESPISESVWNALGVKRLDELNATEAAIRLDALVDAAASDDSNLESQTGDEANSPPRLPGLKNVTAWQTLYGKLLGAVAPGIADRGEHMTLEKLQFLNRVPAQDGDGNWVALSIDELDRAVYYDSIESDWEDRLAKLGGNQSYLLRRPESHFIDAETFMDFWASTGASQASAQYPEIERESTRPADSETLGETLRNPKIKYGILAASPGKEAVAKNRDKYERFTDTLRRIETSSADESGTETAWRVTPLNNGTGLELENVEGAPSYAVAYDERVVDSAEPVELADLFMALFQGGNKDSYKLALLGHDVEGKDEVRAQLRATDVQELETDLRLSARLLDCDGPLERGALDIPEETSVTELREDIANYLRDGRPLSEEGPADLPDSVVGVIDTMCEVESEPLRQWAGALVDSATADRIDELRARLRADVPAETPSDIQLLALKRLEKTLPDDRLDVRLPGISDLLPGPESRQVTELLHELVVGLRQLNDRTKPDIISVDDLRAHDRSISWSEPVITDVERHALPGTELQAVAPADIIPDDCTWFHLAWWLETSDQPLKATEPAETIFDTVGAVIGGESETKREAIKTEVRASVSRGDTDSAGDSTFTESSNTVLLDQIDSDIEWSESDGSLDSELTANLRSGDAGGGGLSIEQTSDQPRVAELAILRDAYAALHEADHSIDQVESKLDEMKQNENFWRTADGWHQLETFAADSLPSPDDLGKSEREFPTVAFDTTDEGKVGFDVIDLTGWAVRQACEASSEDICIEDYCDASTLSPVPVEVKSVNATNPSFKFSLNQYRRAYDFVDGDDSTVPYVLFLVEVSEKEGSDSGYGVEPYQVIVITCPADLRRLLPSELSPNENDSVIDDLILRVLRGGDLIIG
jgi:hypothetical protein